MPLASFFFVGSPEDASRNDGLRGSCPVDRAEFFRVTDISLESLYKAIEGTEVARFRPVVMSDDYAQVTFVFPKDFIERLSNINNSQRSNIVSAWHRSGESPYDNENDLHTLLCELVRLAQLAQATERLMYLWNSL